ncbi:hypothetical protein NQZ68_007062 [Dissostichus eleginoides]|nr:hypothetical protein NQZ68_007062 [Dissostichus eleginoides]
MRVGEIQIEPEEEGVQTQPGSLSPFSLLCSPPASLFVPWEIQMGQIVSKTTTLLNKEDLQYLYRLSISELFCQSQHSENVHQ